MLSLWQVVFLKHVSVQAQYTLPRRQALFINHYSQPPEPVFLPGQPVINDVCVLIWRWTLSKKLISLVVCVIVKVIKQFASFLSIDQVTVWMKNRHVRRKNPKPSFSVLFSRSSASNFNSVTSPLHYSCSWRFIIPIFILRLCWASFDCTWHCFNMTILWLRMKTMLLLLLLLLLFLLLFLLLLLLLLLLI